MQLLWGGDSLARWLLWQQECWRGLLCAHLYCHWLFC